MRIVNQTSLSRVLQPGRTLDCLTLADIAGIEDGGMRNILTALSNWQLPAPSECEFVATLGWCIDRTTRDDGTRKLIFLSMWLRVWFVTTRVDPTAKNSVCVADPEWATLEDLVDREEGGILLVDFIKSAVKDGVAKQRIVFQMAATFHQATAEYEQHVVSCFDQISHDIDIVV